MLKLEAWCAPPLPTRLWLPALAEAIIATYAMLQNVGFAGVENHAVAGISRKKIPALMCWHTPRKLCPPPITTTALPPLHFLGGRNNFTLLDLRYLSSTITPFFGRVSCKRDDEFYLTSLSHGRVSSERHGLCDDDGSDADDDIPPVVGVMRKRSNFQREAPRPAI